MKYLWPILFLLTAPLRAEEQVTHAALMGSWVYYYISRDSFDTSKNIVTEQRLIFTSGEDVTLNIAVRDTEYIQNTTYTLKYALLLRNNTPYLTLYSPESKEVLGAYLRMPVKNGLELSATMAFQNSGANSTQLYRRNSVIMPGQFPPNVMRPEGVITLPQPNTLSFPYGQQ